jgi:hypothetical protein
MPPQQPDRLLDLFNEAFDFSAHGFSDLRHEAAVINASRDVAARATKRNARDANRFPPRIKSGADFRLKTL